MKLRIAVPCAMVSLCAGILAAGCGSSAPEVTVAIASPTGPQTIEAGQTVNITASASSSGGYSAGNVTWSLKGVGCSGSACGTLTGETGTSVTYEAPPTPPPANMTVYVVATAATGAPKSASVAITVAAISVQITNKMTGQAAGTGFLGGGTQLVATVSDDPEHQGITWSLTAAGGACAPACGTLTTSGPNFVQYHPPATVPAAPNNTPTITATSVTDPTKSDSETFTIFDGATACGTGGNESELNGEYAVMVRGWIGSGNSAMPMLFGASFGADGTGKVTGGMDQFNPFVKESWEGAPLLPSASSYSVGSDGRGCLTLTDNLDNTFTLQFSVGGVKAGVASTGDVILFNGYTTTPESGSGILRLQDTSAFSVSALAPDYAFGMDGWEDTKGPLTHFAIAGSLMQETANTSNLSFNINDGGSISTFAGANFNLLGTIQTIYSTGTTTVTLQVPGLGSVQGELYVINTNELFFIPLDLDKDGPVFSGELIATNGSFTPASIAPSYIFRSTGSSAGVAAGSIGLLNFSGGGASGSVSGKLDSYAVGAPATQTVSGSYAFTSASGRLAITGANSGSSPICYLTNPFDGVAGFCISTDSTASLGVMNVQPAATYGNGSLSGNFFFGSEEPGDSTVPDLSGIASISSGNLTGTEDASSSSGLSLGVAINKALSINADGTGTMGANTVLVTNGTEIYFINEANGAPAEVQVFQQQ